MKPRTKIFLMFAVILSAKVAMAMAAHPHQRGSIPAATSR